MSLTVKLHLPLVSRVTDSLHILFLGGGVLAELNVVFNQEYGVLYCRDHDLALPANTPESLEKVRDHIKRSHRNQGKEALARSLVKDLSQKLTFIDERKLALYLSQSSKGAQPPISGLGVIQVFVCNVAACREVSASRSRMIHHQKMIHPKGKGSRPSYREAQAHRLGTRKNPRWVTLSAHVDKELVPALGRDSPFYRAISGLLQQEEPIDAMLHLQQGVRQMSDFHSQIGWEEQMEQIGLVELARLNDPSLSSKSPQWIQLLTRYAGDHWRQMETSLGSCFGHPFRKDLKEETGHVGREEFQRLQPASKVSYQRTYQRFIRMTLTYAQLVTYSTSEAHIGLELQPLVKATFERLESLWDHQRTGKIFRESKPEPPILQLIMESLRSWMQALVTTPYQQADLWNDPVHWYMLSSTVILSKRQTQQSTDPYFRDQDGLDDLDDPLSGSEERSGGDGSEEEGEDKESIPSIVPPNRYSGSFAQVQYSIRLFLWDQAVKILTGKNPDEKAVSRLKKFCSPKKGQYTFYWVRRALCFARKARMDLPPRLSMGYSGSTLWLSVGRVCVTQARLREAVSKIIAKLSSCLETDLLLGLGKSLVDPPENSHVSDVMRCSQLGYSFLADRENSFHARQGDILKMMAVRSELQERFFDKVVDGDYTLRPKAVLAYLEKQKVFLGLLFTALHLACGLPSRGGEYNTLLISETGMRHRSIFHDLNGIFLIFRYSKQTAVFGPTTSIPKYMGSRVGAILKRYLTFALPTLRMFADHLYKDVSFDKKGGGDSNASHKTMGTHLFATHRGILQGDAFGGFFREHMATVGDLPLGLADYRHIAIAFARKFISGATPEMGQLPELLELAANHSSVTGRLHYAHNHQEPENGMAERLLEQYTICSAWQSWIGLSDEAVDMSLGEWCVFRQGSGASH